jgi:hypothetical protein
VTDYRDPLPPGLPARVRGSVIARHLNVTVDCVRGLVKRGVLPPPLRLSARLHLYDVRAVRDALRRAAEAGAP